MKFQLFLLPLLLIELINCQILYQCSSTFRYPHETSELELTCYFYDQPNGQGTESQIISRHNEFIEGSSDDVIKELIFRIPQRFVLPVGIFIKFQNTEAIEIEEPGITDISENSFDGASRLKELKMIDNNLEILKDQSFFGADNLNSINLNSNRISKIESAAFMGLKKLKSLDLSQNLLEEVHKDLFKPLKNLENLDLSKNQIEALEEKSLFNTNAKLELISLSDNRLSAIHIDIFSNLKVLQFLDLQRNICINSHYEKPTKTQLELKSDLENCLPSSPEQENYIIA